MKFSILASLPASLHAGGRCSVNAAAATECRPPTLARLTNPKILPLTTYHLLLTTYYLPLTTYYLLLTIHHLPLTIPPPPSTFWHTRYSEHKDRAFTTIAELGALIRVSE